MARDYAHRGIPRKPYFRKIMVPRMPAWRETARMTAEHTPMSDDARALQRNLKQWRKSRNLTLSALADATGISISMLSDIERGVRRVHMDDIVRLARFYDVHPASMLIAPQEAGPKVKRMLSASHLAEQMTPDAAAEWLAVGRRLMGDALQK